MASNIDEFLRLAPVRSPRAGLTVRLLQVTAAGLGLLIFGTSLVSVSPLAAGEPAALPSQTAEPPISTGVTVGNDDPVGGPERLPPRPVRSLGNGSLGNETLGNESLIVDGFSGEAASSPILQTAGVENPAAAAEPGRIPAAGTAGPGRSAALPRTATVTRPPAIGPTIAACPLPGPDILPDALALWRDDADLHALSFVSKTLGFAAGDQGMVWRTVDGGRSWVPRPIPIPASLRAIFFLTERHGWVAGGVTLPFTQTEVGVLFATTDGGETWERVGGDTLPRLMSIRFFGLETGIAAGASSPGAPAGVLTTSDGGKTWQPLSTNSSLGTQGWTAAAFPSPGRGVVVGPRGRRAVVGDGQLLPTRVPDGGLKGLRGVGFSSPLLGWAVGDGGMILCTSDGGFTWQDPAAKLPEEAQAAFDFHSVAVVGERLWVAGRPGSVIWHSADNGKTWRPQATPSSLPIHAIRFANEAEGLAVGAMGTILRTSDGGITWRVARGESRRAAALVVADQPASVPFPLLASFAGDQGYRMVALLPVRPDLRTGGVEDPSVSLRLRDAIGAVGGHSVVVDWPIPLAVPDLTDDAEAVVAEGNRRTEGRLRDVLVGRLATALRTWRPDVVILDSREGNALGEVLAEATRQAVVQAADPTQMVAMRQTTQLAPWTVKKLYRRLHDGTLGDASFEYPLPLPRLQLTTSDLAEPALARVASRDLFTITDLLLSPNDPSAVPQPAQCGYRLEPLFEGPPPAGPLFGGLAIQPGGDARRAVAPAVANACIDDLVLRQRMLQEIAGRLLGDPRMSAGIIAQLDELTTGLTDAAAARQIFLLASEQRRRAQWDLAEQTFSVLMNRYPQDPTAREAARWLLTYWGTAEPTWSRLQRETSESARATPSLADLPNRIERALSLAESGEMPYMLDQSAVQQLEPAPLQVASGQTQLKTGAGQTYANEVLVARHRQAVLAAGLIRRQEPMLFQSAEVQLPLAVVSRNLPLPEVQKLLGSSTFGPWNPESVSQLALLDSKATTGTTATVRRGGAPLLDGLLSEECWQSAQEVRLASEGGLPEPTIAMFARDDRFLFIAVSVPRQPGEEVPPIAMAGRTHDALLRNQDRIAIAFDLDRDGQSAYHFAIDQRGQTSEHCWGDVTWNPQWYIAAAGDQDRWRIEAAIPFEALLPRPPLPGEVWSMSISRLLPTKGVQGWPHPTGERPRRSDFGLLKFE